MELKLTIRSAGIGNVLLWYDLHDLNVMNSDGRITEIIWEPGTTIRRVVDKNNVEFDVSKVHFRDLKTGKELKCLDACCITGMTIVDSNGKVFPLESCFGSVWCSNCELAEAGDHFAFESDVSRNMYAYIRDALMYDDPSHERCVEEIECAAYENYVDYAPSFVPDREDMRILHALAEHYPSINTKTASDNSEAVFCGSHDESKSVYDLCTMGRLIMTLSGWTPIPIISMKKC